MNFNCWKRLLASTFSSLFISVCFSPCLCLSTYGEHHRSVMLLDLTIIMTDRLSSTTSVVGWPVSSSNYRTLSFSSRSDRMYFCTVSDNDMRMPSISCRSRSKVVITLHFMLWSSLFVRSCFTLFVNQCCICVGWVPFVSVLCLCLSLSLSHSTCCYFLFIFSFLFQIINGEFLVRIHRLVFKQILFSIIFMRS
jgi:hypothetical protein